VETRIWSEDFGNMAGFDWTWSIFIDRDFGGWSLRCEREAPEPPDGECEAGEDCEGCESCDWSPTDEPDAFDDLDNPGPVRVANTGEGLYEGLSELVGELGSYFAPSMAGEVAALLETRAPELAADLRLHARRVEALQVAAAERVAAERAAAAEKAAAEEAARKAARKAKAASKAPAREAKAGGAPSKPRRAKAP
jgi:hypothetical protein